MEGVNANKKIQIVVPPGSEKYIKLKKIDQKNLFSVQMKSNFWVDESLNNSINSIKDEDDDAI